MHRRLRPKVHGFTYRIFMFYLDLSELGEVSRRARLFSVNRPNLYSLFDGDHLHLTEGGIRANVEAFLRRCGIHDAIEGVRLLTFPRAFGYIFNPISIYFCFGKDGRPLTSVAEIGNTFLEQKPYLVPAAADGFRTRTTKHFYVSPFSELDLDFDFRFETPGDRLSIHIDDYRDGERTLVSSLTGKRREISLASLLAMTAKYPLITLKVIGGIHWEAFRLWLKKVPHYRKEANPHLQRDVLRPHKTLDSVASRTPAGARPHEKAS